MSRSGRGLGHRSRCSWLGPTMLVEEGSALKEAYVDLELRFFVSNEDFDNRRFIVAGSLLANAEQKRRKTHDLAWEGM